MRDLLLLAVLVGIIPLIVRAPIVGLVAWVWIALMNPQREVYGFLAGVGLNFIIAVVALFAWAVSRERKIAPSNPTILVLGLFVIWTCITTAYALEPVRAIDLLVRTLKTAVLLFAIAAMANTKARIQAMIWIIAISLGYFGVKGGAFVLASGGTYRVFGPEASMIQDNNHLGLALVILLPLLNYLRTSSQMRSVRLALLGGMGLTFVAVLGTYSRGALLALGAMVAVAAARSRAGILMLVAGGLMLVAAPHVMPAAWLERMGSIQTADEDSSFMGRVEAWRTSFNVAEHRPTGGGFAAIEHTSVAEAFPTPGGLKTGRAAHSIYFQVLGDHGFIGLALFLGLLASALVNTSLTLHATRRRPELAWANQLARAFQVSIIAFIVGGAALSMAYYDGFLIVIVLSAVLHQTVRRGVTTVAAPAAPKWRVVEVEPKALPRPEAT